MPLIAMARGQPMLTVTRPKKRDVPETQNKQLFLALGVAALIAAIGCNLDVPAGWLLQLGRADLAAPCLEVMTTVNHDMHIKDVRTANALTKLAVCYAQDNKMDLAIEIEQQAVNTYKGALGSDASQVLIGTGRIGQYLNQKGNCLRAEMILNDAVQDLERKAAPDTEATALVYSTLAESLLAQKKDTQALAILEKLVPIDERYMMLTQKSVDAYEKLGALYAKMGRTNLSKQTIEAGIAIKERILGANNVQLGSSYEKLSAMQNALGEKVDAQKSLTRAQQIWKRI